MAISLKKGQRVGLSDNTNIYTKLVIGLGWDVRVYNLGVDFDLDASAFMLSTKEKIVRETDFVYYNNLVSTCGSIMHTGDNRTGEGDGDDEQVVIDLLKVPDDIVKIAITVTIHDADIRRQNFGMVSNAYVRVLDFNTERELLRYDLAEEFSIETAVVVCEIYKYNGHWKFAALGNGFAGGLETLCSKYGLDTEG